MTIFVCVIKKLILFNGYIEIWGISEPMTWQATQYRGLKPGTDVRAFHQEVQTRKRTVQDKL